MFLNFLSVFSPALKLHAIPNVLAGSFAVHPGDHLRFWDLFQTNVGIICGLGIICGVVQNYVFIQGPIFSVESTKQHRLRSIERCVFGKKYPI